MLNNFHLLRVIAAFLVFWGHSYVFLGLTEPLFLGFKFGPLGVIIFFTISGYLISESWSRDDNLIRFFAKRALRILPALVIFVLIAIFILGPFVTTLSVKEYFSNKYTYYYLRNIFFHISYYLPGVFENLRVANAINGSLWSLPVEVAMYILLALGSFVTSSKRFIYLTLFIISAVVSIFWANRTDKMVVIYATDLRQIFITGTYFWAGAVFFAFDLKRYCSIPRVVISLVILVVLSREPFIVILYPVSLILLPYLILSFGLSPSLKELEWVTKPGDYSYGFYIYSFPIQQLIVMLKPDLDLSIYLVVCLLLTLPIAFMSWKIIEKPALLMKPKKFEKITIHENKS